MKKIMTTILVAVTMFTMIGTLTSCEKEMDNEIKSKVVAVQDATNVGFKEKKCCQCSCGPNPWATLGADFLGAMAGGEIGVAGGPWGIFAGSVIGGVAGSVSIWRVMNPQVNTEPGIYGHNPFNYLGESHNLLCQSIISDTGVYFDEEGNLTNEYQNLIVEHCINLYPECDENYLRSIDYNSIVKKIDLFYFSGGELTLISDPDLSSFAQNFIYDLGRCQNENEARDLIQNRENSIINSSLPESKKQIILISLAVASHSNQLWD